MMLFVDVHKVLANPWQTRQGVDEAHVQDLAKDIESRRASRDATKGLLQVPAGRAVEASGKAAGKGRTDKELETAIGEGSLLVQLAYGHNRLAAFRLLADKDPFYSHMPVDLVEFDDQEMATSAWGENYARKDLTPLEQAKAIAMMMEDFGWKQREVAERLGLTQSTVANKLRLLKLPEEVQSSMQVGKVSERQAMAILPLTSLPETAIATLPEWQQRDARKLVEQVGKMDSEELRRRVDEVVKQTTRDLAKAIFPRDWSCDVEGTQSPACDGCKVRRGDSCVDLKCYNLRWEEWQRQRLAEISAAIGVAAWDPAEAKAATYGDHTRFYRYDEDAVIFARKCSCKNLRVTVRDGYELELPGHPEAGYVCVHGARKHCTCKSKMTAEKAKEEEAEKREQRRQINAIKHEMTARLAVELDTGSTPAMKALALYNMWGADREKILKLTDRAEILRQLAAKVMNNACSWEYGSLAERQNWAREWWRSMGLDGDQGGDGHRGAEGLEEFRRRFDRIQGWMAQPLIERLASDEAIRGNIDNLERLMTGLGELPQDETVESLALQMARAQRELEELLATEPAH